MPVWALAVYGIIATADPGRPVAAVDRPGREHRRNLIFNLVALALALLVGLGMLNNPGFPPVRVLGALIAVAAIIARDLVRSQQTSELLGRLSFEGRNDPLTQCGNRLALRERLDVLQAQASPVQILTVDLDGFKHVNTQYGLSVGDRVLREVAEALRTELTGLGAVFRLGGDEFAVVVPGGSPLADEAAERVHRAVGNAAARLHDLGTMSLSASIGVDSHSSKADQAHGLQETLTRSGAAMTAAKARGRSRTVRYDEAISAAAERAAQVQVRLSNALNMALNVPGDQADPFRIVFQSMHGRSGEVVAVEALARWHDDELGEVSPEEFIPVAESTGLIDRLGARVLTLAIEQFVSVAAPEVGLALNVSTIQLRSPRFAAELAGTLARHKLATERVLIEVTESVLVREGDPALRTLFQLAESGFAIAVDDFGSGYSSLGYLGRLPVTVIKLDAALVRHLDQPRSVAIARSVVDMAEALSLGVVAEGIETIEQLRATRAMGIAVGQGYLLGRPCPIDDLGLGDKADGCGETPRWLWTRFIPVSRSDSTAL